MTAGLLISGREVMIYPAMGLALLAAIGLTRRPSRLPPAAQQVRPDERLRPQPAGEHLHGEEPRERPPAPGAKNRRPTPLAPWEYALIALIVLGLATAVARLLL